MTSVKTRNEVQLIFGDGAPFGHEVSSAVDTGNIHKIGRALTYTRQAIRDFENSDRPDVPVMIDQINANFRREVGSAEFPPDQRRLVTRAGIIRTLCQASDEELRSFCCWNVERHQDRQAALDAVTPELHEHTVGRIERLVEVGLFPKSSPSIFAEALENADGYEAIDSFEAGGMLAAGYCLIDDQWVALANHFENPVEMQGISPVLQRVSIHESGHLAGGAVKGGFFNGIIAPRKPGDPPFRWLEEAFMGHMVQVASNTTDDPQPERFDPDDRCDPHGDGSYVGERRFLSMVLEEGIKPVQVGLIAEAFMEPAGYSSMARTELYSSLSSSLADMFPRYADAPIELMSQVYEATPRHKRSDLMADWYDRACTNLGIELCEEPSPLASLVFVRESVDSFDLSKFAVHDKLV